MCIIVNAQVQWYVTSKEYNHDDKYYGLLNKTLVNIHSKPLDSVRPSTMPQLRKINRCYQIFHKHQNNCFPFRNLDSIYYRNLVINFCFVFFVLVFLISKKSPAWTSAPIISKKPTILSHFDHKKTFARLSYLQ